MKNPTILSIEQSFYRKNPLPEFSPGDTICAWIKILEGTEKDGTPKYRLQAFAGVCLRFRKGTTNSTFLVRKISAAGIGVERNFFVHSPLLDRVEVKAYGQVRKSRIYYIKKLKGKAARIQSRFVPKESATSISDQKGFS